MEELIYKNKLKFTENKKRFKILTVNIIKRFICAVEGTDTLLIFRSL